MSCQPPINFGLVCPGVYRSGFPGRHNLTFLQRLGLRSVIRLAEGEYAPEVAAWLKEQGIVVWDCAMITNQEPFVVMDTETLHNALDAALTSALRPVLVHCLRGQQLTGVLVGCMRKLQRWSLAATFDEYRRYAGPASSLLDLQLIELLDVRGLIDGGSKHTVATSSALATKPSEEAHYEQRSQAPPAEQAQSANFHQSCAGFPSDATAAPTASRGAVATRLFDV